MTNEEEIGKLFDKEGKGSNVEKELMGIFCEGLALFTQTPEYLCIPKTDDFMVLCTLIMMKILKIHKNGYNAFYHD